MIGAMQGLPLPPNPSVSDRLDWAKQLYDRAMQSQPMLIDPSYVQGGQQFIDAAQKFAQGYGPLLDVLLSSDALGGQTRGPTTQFDKSGGWEQANKDFDSLKLDNVRDLGNGVRTGELPDGRIVTVRPFSSGPDGGQPTLDIPSGKGTGKIRYAQ